MDAALSRYVALAQHASPGPLRLWHNPDLPELDYLIVSEDEHTVAQLPHCDTHPGRTTPDGELFVVAREAVLSLAAEADRWRLQMGLRRIG
jgi:hypothetical protein